MAEEERPFCLVYECVEVGDADERVRRAFAILEAAGKRHRQQAEAGGDGHVVNEEEDGSGQGGAAHGEGGTSS